MPDPSPHALRLPALAAYRAATARRRALAFCGLPGRVLGIPLGPVTPRTYSLLHASRSPYLFGGTPLEGDVLAFLWYHSPTYVLPGHPEWAARKRPLFRALRRQLQPAWRRWLRLPPDWEHYAAALALANADISAHLDAAFADAPPASGQPRAPLATLEAALCHQFAAAYAWTPERTRETPLAQLFQYDRLLAASRGAEVRDDGEDRLLAAHLAARQAALPPPRPAEAPAPVAPNSQPSTLN